MRLSWDQPEQRRYESGVDRGVLYPSIGPGVSWNGLQSVEESSVGGEVEAFYFDGIKYLEKAKPKAFQATITAFSTPYEFADCVGEKQVVPGFTLTRQPRSRFGFSYRTLINEGDDYEIHVVYNALASNTQRGYSTLSDSPEPSSFSWLIDAVPPKSDTHRPSAHFVFDTTKTDLFTLRAVEDILYGTSSRDPRLPSVDELIDIISEWSPVLITPSQASSTLSGGDPSASTSDTIDGGSPSSTSSDILSGGTYANSSIATLEPGLGDLSPSRTSGLYRELPTTRLAETAVGGLYRLE